MHAIAIGVGSGNVRHELSHIVARQSAIVHAAGSWKGYGVGGIGSVTGDDSRGRILQSVGVPAIGVLVSDLRNRSVDGVSGVGADHWHVKARLVAPLPVSVLGANSIGATVPARLNRRGGCAERRAVARVHRRTHGEARGDTV